MRLTCESWEASEALEIGERDWEAFSSNHCWFGVSAFSTKTICEAEMSCFDNVVVHCNQSYLVVFPLHIFSRFTRHRE